MTRNRRTQTRLYHFTCDHGHDGLGTNGTLQPQPHPLLPQLSALTWMTTDPNPTRDDCGLTSTMLDCDRMEYRYRVTDRRHCIPWARLRQLATSDVLAILESYGKPDTWWVARTPIPVVLDQP